MAVQALVCIGVHCNTLVCIEGRCIRKKERKINYRQQFSFTTVFLTSTYSHTVVIYLEKKWNFKVGFIFRAVLESQENGTKGTDITHPVPT